MTGHLKGLQHTFISRRGHDWHSSESHHWEDGKVQTLDGRSDGREARRRLLAHPGCASFRVCYRITQCKGHCECALQVTHYFFPIQSVHSVYTLRTSVSYNALRFTTAFFPIDEHVRLLATSCFIELRLFCFFLHFYGILRFLGDEFSMNKHAC